MRTTKSCEEKSGRVIPVVNRNKCEGKAACVEVCPFDVFAMGILSTEEKRSLSLIGKIKSFAHGGKQAFVVNPEACRACDKCVAICPEGAITLNPYHKP